VTSEDTPKYALAIIKELEYESVQFFDTTAAWRPLTDKWSGDTIYLERCVLYIE